jgi:hypothetical protein
MHQHSYSCGSFLTPFGVLEIRYFEQEKMQTNMHFAVHEHKIKTVATKLKTKKIKRYALEKEICSQYAFAAIAIIVMVVIAL